jgi:hypothetical protein
VNQHVSERPQVPPEQPEVDAPNPWFAETVYRHEHGVVLSKAESAKISAQPTALGSTPPIALMCVSTHACELGKMVLYTSHLSIILTHLV